ncbi:hypothetical protein CSKR_109624 [Clonorchis sinensis]|uniref:Uncharacterized protein n=2 Tax=Clonorchis sinensis TaxID=79923 RepID=G7YFH9_CLOSI|nr:hypothetical protein CSKR_109624 [Clonorchis sinensis]GAA51712.1 hypothetical protein CLF_106677 [Clonorchis sinensis]
MVSSKWMNLQEKGTITWYQSIRNIGRILLPSMRGTSMKNQICSSWWKTSHYACVSFCRKVARCDCLGKRASQWTYKSAFRGTQVNVVLSINGFRVNNLSFIECLWMCDSHTVDFPVVRCRSPMKRYRKVSSIRCIVLKNKTRSFGQVTAVTLIRISVFRQETLKDVAMKRLIHSGRSEYERKSEYKVSQVLLEYEATGCYSPSNIPAGFSIAYRLIARPTY